MIEKLGLPLSILAWLSVFFAAIAMGIFLGRFSLRKVWIPSLIVGGISLTAHLLDYFVTLKVSPTLSHEANPIWRIVIDNFGLNFARLYGLTGKILLAMLSFEFFAYYLIQRDNLFPKHTRGFLSFWREFGISEGRRPVVCFSNLTNIFCFTFALLGPFIFYVVFLNSLSLSPLYYRLPSLPSALVLYTFGLVIAYLVTTYQVFKSSCKNRRTR